MQQCSAHQESIIANAKRRVNDVAKTIYVVTGDRTPPRQPCRYDDVGIRPDRGRNRCEDYEEWRLAGLHRRQYWRTVFTAGSDQLAKLQQTRGCLAIQDG